MTYAIDSLGIYRPKAAVIHRNDEYEETGFKLLLKMQSKHFWYLGRHKFILTALRRLRMNSKLSAIDLGGGVGGWIQYLRANMPAQFNELALADSSEVALLNAKTLLPSDVLTYQVDLMNLEWENRWDLAFMLDVIEHCPDDLSIVREAAKALKPGGKLIVTTPALDYFWSYNDVYAKHFRRYKKADFKRLSNGSGLILKDARYFMFYLSPLYWLSRNAKSKNASKQEIELAIKKEHQLPNSLINGALRKIFCAESPSGHLVHFPWGTSILAILEKGSA